jgi:hypothetical protein
LVQTRFGVGVGRVDMATNGILELARAAVTASSKSLVSELGEPALDEIDPRRVGLKRDRKRGCRPSDRIPSGALEPSL